MIFGSWSHAILRCHVVSDTEMLLHQPSKIAAVSLSKMAPGCLFRHDETQILNYRQVDVKECMSERGFSRKQTDPLAVGDNALNRG